MGLRKLAIFNVRNIKEAAILPTQGFNLFFGDNGSGKSSLLEAIYILGRAQSFRSPNIKKAINFDTAALTVSGLATRADGGCIQLGVQSDGKDTVMRVDRQDINSRAQLAYALPLQLIYPKSYLLLDGSPQFRREFIDWGAFHQDAQFLPAWRRYKKALAQRNSLLKQRQTRQIDVWNRELLEYGTMVADLRQAYVAALQPLFIDIANQFVGLDGLRLQAYNGWDKQGSFPQALEQGLERDLRDGFTHSGPHRGDLLLVVSGRLAHEFVSRGQLKLLVLALKLAQVALLDARHRQNGCVLIDDMAAELDLGNQGRLMRYLAGLGMQIFITATNKDGFGKLSGLDDVRMFHVEHGDVKQL